MRENLQTGLSRGRRSRNKVSVGEPAEGSFVLNEYLILVDSWMTAASVSEQRLFSGAELVAKAAAEC